MSRRIRWLGVVILACFVTLFVQLNNLQVVKAHSYATSQNNPAVIAAKYNQPRGAIVSADGHLLAQSVLATSPPWKYQRQYPTGALFGQITGYFSHQYGTEDGVELSYNSYLVAHNKPVKTIRDLLTTRTVTDTVTLTVSDKLQTDAQQALAGRNGAIVVMDPSTGALEAMYSNPNFDPNPLASSACAVSTGTGAQKTCTQTVAQQAWAAYTTNDSEAFNPLTSIAYQDISPPGSTFKVVTTSAVYTHAPQFVSTSVPSFSCIPPGYFAGQTTKLCNDGGTSCGGTIAVMLPESCDPGYAILGTKVGAASMTAEADAFGFNQQPPLDLPPSQFQVSQFLQPDCYGNAEIFLAFSSIGQKCTAASPLQMAMVAAGIANGGAVMTPHVMSEIRDSQGNLVTTYKPTVWKRPVSQQTASAVTTLMEAVAQNGTAKGVFPASEDVAAKTGTAQVANNTKTTDWMIAFAPANAPKVAVAVEVPFQALSDYGATVAGPVVQTMIADVLGGH